MDERDLAYAAGLIDGEGWIGMRKKKGIRNKGRAYSYAIGVSVGMANQELPEWLCSMFGGVVCKRLTKQANRHDSWHWQIEHGTALLALRSILPYLKLKRPQAELAIQFQEAIKPRQYKYHPKTQQELALEEMQVTMMRSLNHFGEVMESNNEFVGAS